MEKIWNVAIGQPPGKRAAAAITKLGYDHRKKNIEELLSKAEAYIEVTGDSDVKAFTDDCKSIILSECSSFLDVKKLEAHKTFLHRLSRRRVRDPRLKIFTTNYDLCFERAASALGGVVIDGFSFMPPRHFDPKYFSYDIIRRPRNGEDQGNYLEGVFHLFKLHGSVNWTRDKEGLIYESAKPSPDEACLIYPANGKYHQSFLQPHLESMSQYFASLREPNTCFIVVGFGFHDEHLAEPLIAAASSNPNLRIILVNPKIDSQIGEASNNRFWKALDELRLSGEDVWFLNSSFENFAKLVPDLKALTPGEKIVKAIQAIATK